MHRQFQINKGVTGFKQASLFIVLLAFFTFLLLFSNVNLASAQEASGAKTSKSVPAIEQILRVELTPSLSAEADQETSTDGSRVAMFRLYNKWTGEHFYTSSKSERDNIVKAGWVYEQIEWYAPTSEDFKPVYRLYNKYVSGGDHHYTTSSDEKDECIKAGWTYEGEGWRTVEVGATDYVKVLRQYNPYGTTGTHNYTTDEDEQKYLVSLGWRAEADGGWGGYKTLEPSTPTPTTKEIDFTKAVVDTADKIYTSKAITPKATVTGLTAGTDYVVTYSNNVNAGTATITITGKGNYKGTKTYNFTIKPVNISNAVVTLGDSLTYNAKEQTQTVSKVVAGSITLATSDYEVSGNKQMKAGNHKLTIKGKGNFGGSKEVSFAISQLSIDDAQITLGAALTYNAKEQTQSVASVMASGIGLLEGDFEVSDNTATNAGDYTLTVTGKGNCKGTATKGYKISKADPAYEIPGGLSALTGELLTSITLPEYDGSGDKTAGKWAWDEQYQADQTVGDTATTISFKAKFIPNDTNNYNSPEAVDVAVVVSAGGLKATFVANAPSGKTATVNGFTTKTNIIWDYDKAGETTHTILPTDFPTATIDDSDYFLAGWATDASLGYGSTQKQLIGTKVTNHPTYYAVWKTETGYWLGTAGADEKYTNEAYFAENDSNYHSSVEIDSDMKALHNSESTYDEVKAKWDAYYSGNSVRLYATYAGGENEQAKDNSVSERNKYVEFRILEVSGKDGHAIDADKTTQDGSVVTFMTTHLLPTAYQMNTDLTNVGGWALSSLRAKMYKSGGEIYDKFSTNFTDAIKSVKKEYHTGYDGTTGGEKLQVTDTFWVPSFKELAHNGGASMYSTIIAKEGNQYKWCADNNIADMATDLLIYKTRAGNTPGKTNQTEVLWWERSTFMTQQGYFGAVYKTGSPISTPFSYFNSNNYLGVVLAFCF